jgi:hypothetical protein
MDDDVIALFAFEPTDEGIRVSYEKHYRLVPRDQMSSEDLKAYKAQGDAL